MSTFSIENHLRSAGDLVDHISKKVKVDTSVSAPSLAAPADWSQLPYEILLHVFRYLNDNSDKYHAALTCKSWLRPLSEPSLWKSGDFVFNAKSRTKAVRFVRIAGQSLRHVKADYPESKDKVYCNEELYQFLANLINSRNQRLVTFKLTNLQYLKNLEYSGVRKTDEIIDLLKKLLNQQRQLRVLDLSNSKVPYETGMKLLVTYHCPYTVHTLVINKLFKYYSNSRQYIPDFVTTVCSFKNLSELELSYEYLCNDLLLRLSKTPRSLKVITIRAGASSSNYQSTSFLAAWQQLTAACPELRAVVYISKPKQEAHINKAPSDILTLSIPLYKVSWDAGGLIAIENIEQFFQRVSRDFYKTLHHIELKTGVRLDKGFYELLFKSFQTCRHLDTVSVDVTCDRRSDQDDYMFVITDVMTRCPVSYDVILNGHKVKPIPSE